MTHRFLFLFLLIGMSRGSASGAESTNPRAVPTFECLGLSWKTTAGSDDLVCNVRFRMAEADDWREALPLWFDRRNGEYRGSIVGLTPGRRYEVELILSDAQQTKVALSVATRSEEFPIARTVPVPAANRKSDEPLVITEGGTADGYVLYSPAENEPDGAITSVVVRAPFVILRGLTIHGAPVNAVELQDPAHHVVVEQCDISGWGRRNDQGFGINYDSGIYSKSKELHSVVIQRNRIHHPRYSSNDWTQTRSELRSRTQQAWQGDDFRNHAMGPQAISWAGNRGRHVIRYNDITSDERHAWNDALGGWENFSAGGFPGPDTDIYANLIQNAFDDGIEAEGGGCNVRIWGNFFDRVHQSVATVSVTQGPLYVFRNVVCRTRATPDGRKHEASRSLGKVGSHTRSAALGYGRQYWLHNTVLQPGPGDGETVDFGSNVGLAATSDGVTELVSYNNILHVRGATVRTFGREANQKQVAVPQGLSIADDYLKRGSNVFDYDLYNGEILFGSPETERHGIHGTPRYALGHGPASGTEGRYQLAPDSPGFDAAKRLPNFNDDYRGQAPDVGAHESGTAGMEFGVGGYLQKATSSK